MLTIRTENFGPIEKGEVKLRPLTVLIGANNVGKSYLALLTYTVVPPWRFGDEGMWWYEPQAFVGWPETPRRLKSWMKQHRSDSVLVRDMPPEHRQFLKGSVDGLMAGVPGIFERELQRCFASDAKSLSRKNGGVGFSVEIEESSIPFRLSLELRDEKITEQHAIDIKGVCVKLSSLDLEDLAWGVIAELSREFPIRSFYLPAARSGILQSHRLLASALVKRSSLAGIEPLELPRLPGVIADFISLLLQLGPRLRRPSDIVKVASFLERGVSKGRIDIQPSEGSLGYPEIFYETGAGKMPLARASSMISEMAPVQLLLKYTVNKGDMLIIEEPEAHLHPDNQRVFAHAIVKLIRAGVRVLLTTHSSDFLQQLSNFVKLGDRKAQRRQLGYSDTDYLESEEVSAYLFRLGKPSPRGVQGSTIEELPVSAQNGIPDDEFGRINEELYNETVALEMPRG